ncbi:50S ribosomal protein L32 [Desulfosarcina sp. OttesenSCG-928-A07]|nr:50S ribosomal protein L32 [Desulfosarcina sp. OttesenSCG-928-G17]MDL2329746.1 50S ribosomal protein L32 [Desulfosarcina sp. OttesenSCG-928-A07]
MAVPKHKVSKSKRDKRRTHKKIEAISVGTCPECGEAKLPHHVCPECGVYRDKAVVSAEI